MSESLSLQDYIAQRIAFLKAENERNTGEIRGLENLRALTAPKPEPEPAEKAE